MPNIHQALTTDSQKKVLLATIRSKFEKAGVRLTINTDSFGNLSISGQIRGKNKANDLAQHLNTILEPFSDMRCVMHCPSNFFSSYKIEIKEKVLSSNGVYRDSMKYDAQSTKRLQQLLNDSNDFSDDLNAIKKVSLPKDAHKVIDDVCQIMTNINSFANHSLTDCNSRLKLKGRQNCILFPTISKVIFYEAELLHKDILAFKAKLLYFQQIISTSGIHPSIKTKLNDCLTFINRFDQNFASIGLNEIVKGKIRHAMKLNSSIDRHCHFHRSDKSYSVLKSEAWDQKNKQVEPSQKSFRASHTK
jgi:hypothetical protein